MYQQANDDNGQGHLLGGSPPSTHLILGKIFLSLTLKSSWELIKESELARLFFFFFIYYYSLRTLASLPFLGHN